MSRKRIQRYSSFLLIFLSPNLARRRKLIITKSFLTLPHIFTLGYQEGQRLRVEIFVKKAKPFLTFILLIETKWSPTGKARGTSMTYPPTPPATEALRCARTTASEGYPPVAKSAEAAILRLSNRSDTPHAFIHGQSPWSSA